MQVNLDDNSNFNIRKTEDNDVFEMVIDGRIVITFSRSELKFLNALIDSALQEDAVMSKESLQNSLKDAVEKYKPQLQLILRNMKAEDIAHALWYVGEKSVTEVIMTNISKRTAEDVQTFVKEGIERRIRKEKAEGNSHAESAMKEHGRNIAANLLKKLLSA